MRACGRTARAVNNPSIVIPDGALQRAVRDLKYPGMGELEAGIRGSRLAPDGARPGRQPRDCERTLPLLVLRHGVAADAERRGRVETLEPVTAFVAAGERHRQRQHAEQSTCRAHCLLVPTS